MSRIVAIAMWWMTCLCVWAMWNGPLLALPLFVCMAVITIRVGWDFWKERV
jgi:hypothetical protein